MSKSGKFFFQLVIFAIVIALILSIGRLFLAASDRDTGGSDYFSYDLTKNSDASAFVSTIVIGLLIMIGAMAISKNYEVLTKPIKWAGFASILIVTLMTYLPFAFDSDYAYSPEKRAGLAIITFVIGLEWLFLLISSWRFDSAQKINKSVQ